MTARAVTWIVAACCATLASTQVPAEVRGTRTCHKWVEERGRAENVQEMNKIPVLISKSWFLGYSAGRASKARQDFLAGSDNESLFLWLDKYCAEHPQDDLARAGQALEAELTPVAKTRR